MSLQADQATIADWAHLRAPALSDLFALDRPTMPQATTWNRVFADADRLLMPVRGHWRIENGLFYRRGRPSGRITNAAVRRRIYAAFADHALSVLTAP